MKFLKALLILSFVTALLMASASTYLWIKRVPLLEKSANQTTAELFEGTLRLKDVQITKSGKVILHNIEGKMKTDSGRVPIQIQSIESTTSLLQILMTQRSEMRFTGFQPIPLTGEALSGNLIADFSNKPSFEINSSFHHISIRDFSWIDPASFDGLNGFVSGSIRFRTDANEKIELSVNLVAEKEGGEVPARFLEFALPYLPQAKNTKDLQKKIASAKSVPFVNGSVKAQTLSSEKIQAEIKMLFPEQNINLNLNLTILVDEENAFLRTFKLLSLFKVTSQK